MSVSSMTGDLPLRWRALVGASPAAHAAGEDLLARWAEPHRRYHTRAHLAAVLDAADELIAEADPARLPDPDAIRLAAWFHDAVYDGHPGDDEEASAALAVATLRALDLPAGTVEEVERLVLLTATHDPDNGDTPGEILCDADLSMLGADPDGYAAYAAAVREEYADVPADAFRTGRASVLEHLQRRDPLYRTPGGRRRWEEAAHRNLAAELARLTGGPG